jgi:hypothetical protein
VLTKHAHSQRTCARCSLFEGRITEEDLAMVGQRAVDGDDRTRFYIDLYLALYAECKGEADKAKHYISAAVASPYVAASSSGDYMGAVARVHQVVRDWA